MELLAQPPVYGRLYLAGAYPDQREVAVVDRYRRPWDAEPAMRCQAGKRGSAISWRVAAVVTAVLLITSLLEVLSTEAFEPLTVPAFVSRCGRWRRVRGRILS